MERQRVTSGTAWEDEVGYSRAVRVGDRIEVSGTTATGENGDIVAEGDPYAQTAHTKSCRRLPSRPHAVVRSIW